MKERKQDDGETRKTGAEVLNRAVIPPDFKPAVLFSKLIPDNVSYQEKNVREEKAPL